jgi:2,5-diketo-D-gluconate reductase B
MSEGGKVLGAAHTGATTVRRADPRGFSMPSLGFGTVRLRDEVCRDAVAHALAVGYRSIDTAQRYGNEEAVGAALAMSSVPRGDVFVTTKLDFTNYTAAGVARGTRESLRRLRCDYVDLLLIHWPSDEIPLRETLGAMAELTESGLVRFVGVSNFTPALLREASAIADIVVNQVEYHPYLRQRELLDVHAELDLVLTAYSPLARGRVVDDPALKDIAAGCRRTVAQVVLRWLLQQELVTAVVRSGTPSNRASNFQIFDFDLSDEAMARIHALAVGDRIIDPPFAPDWER